MKGVLWNVKAQTSSDILLLRTTFREGLGFVPSIAQRDTEYILFKTIVHACAMVVAIGWTTLTETLLLVLEYQLPVRSPHFFHGTTCHVVHTIGLATHSKRACVQSGCWVPTYT